MKGLVEMARMTREQRREAAKQRARELQETIATQVADLEDSGQWQAMLDQMRKFHAYSVNNVILIWSQMQGASRVAGYRKWQSLGRQVRKGEKAIKIYGFSRVKVDPNDDSEDPEMRTIFPIVNVFDISQTDVITEGDNAGKWVEEDHVIPEIAGDNDYGIYDKLAAWLQGKGWRVTVGDTGRAGGWMDDQAREIRVAEGRPKAQMAATLIHEAAHALLHDGITDYRQHRGRYETEAESVAYVVAGALGFDTGLWSIGYVANWSRGDMKLIKESAGNVLKAANTLLDALA